MSEVTAAVWAEMVAAHERAEAAAEAAYRAYVGAPAFARAELQARCEALGAAYDEEQERLLAVEPPTAAAAAYQLRLFALGHHLADPEEAPLPDEEEDVAILRRIYLALMKLGARAS